ncbi:hypothetical protein RQP46_007679 [Phenoliferia psychrophenolica]
MALDANGASTAGEDLANGGGAGANGSGRGQKRPRESNQPQPPAPAPAPAAIPAAPTAAVPKPAPLPSSAHRRIELIVFSGYEIQAAFPSPYPFDDSLGNDDPNNPNSATQNGHGGEKRHIVREGHGRFGSTKPGPGGAGGGRNHKAGGGGSKRRRPSAAPLVVNAVPVEAEAEAAHNGASDTGVAPPLYSPELELGLLEDLEARALSPELGLAPESYLDHHTAPTSIASTSATDEPVQPSKPPSPPALPLPPPNPTSRRPSASLSPLIGSNASLASQPGAIPFVEIVRSSSQQHQPPRAPSSSRTSPSLTPAPPALPTPIPPLSLAPTPLPDLEPAPQLEPTPTADPDEATNAETVRGGGGRFLAKPAGESVKSRRRLAKVARAAEEQALPPGAEKPLTVRLQRARDKALREAREKANPTPPAAELMTTKRLFVCRGCFKYMVHERAYTAHEKVCDFKHPPGRKVYQRGAHTIWEVDGANAKLYCQNLCLFAKLFIEHKYMFFDLEGFMFYILTDATPSQDWVYGYFSKEKVSYDDYNLACIVIFPPFQKQNFGTLLIEFSYELSRRLSSSPGTPERPLSDLGLKGYLAYWTGVLVRYFLAVFAARGEPDQLLELEHQPNNTNGESSGRHRRSRGWDGELPAGVSSTSTTLTLRRSAGGTPIASIKKEKSPELMAIAQEQEEDGEFEFPTNLEDVAYATNLRKEDVAYALVESGLASWRRRKRVVKSEEDEAGIGGEDEGELDELVITPELLEEVLVKRRVKRAMVMELAHVLL